VTDKEITIEQMDDLEVRYSSVVQSGKVWDMVIAGLSYAEIVDLLEKRVNNTGDKNDR
jgi:hypothetical protein